MITEATQSSYVPGIDEREKTLYTTQFATDQSRSDMGQKFAPIHDGPRSDVNGLVLCLI